MSCQYCSVFSGKNPTPLRNCIYCNKRPCITFQSRRTCCIVCCCFQTGDATLSCPVRLHTLQSYHASPLYECHCVLVWVSLYKIHVAMWAFLNTVKTIQVPWNSWSFFTSCLSRSTLFHEFKVFLVTYIVLIHVIIKLPSLLTSHINHLQYVICISHFTSKLEITVIN